MGHRALTNVIMKTMKEHQPSNDKMCYNLTHKPKTCMTGLEIKSQVRGYMYM